MPLTIIQQNGLSCPVFICDHCGEEIKDASSGNYYWDIAEKTTDIRTAHKSCNKSFEAVRGKQPVWGELTWLIVYLIHNTKMTPEKIKTVKEQLASMP